MVVSLCLCVCLYAGTYVNAFVYLCACLFMPLYVYVFMLLCLLKCLSINVFIHYDVLIVLVFMSCMFI